MIGLTPKQMKLFDFIRTEIEATGVAPSLEQMAFATGCQTRGGVGAKLIALESKGYIRRTRYAHRSIEVLRPRIVELNPEIHRLTTQYAVEHNMPLEAAANDLLRGVLVPHET